MHIFLATATKSNQAQMTPKLIIKFNYRLNIDGFCHADVQQIVKKGDIWPIVDKLDTEFYKVVNLLK